MAATAGVDSPEMKASKLVAWLKREFDLGHGLSLAAPSAAPLEAA